MSKQDGGPAFPRSGDQVSVTPQDGMSLRDWFAGTAPSPPPGWTSRHRDAGLDDLSIEVTWRWGYAEAMLKAREEKPS